VLQQRAEAGEAQAIATRKFPKGGLMKIDLRLLLTMGVLSAGAQGAEWKALSGTYAITPEFYLDPSIDEPANSHIRFQLEGDAAKDLYDALPGEAVKDDCTGQNMKSAGEVRCRFDGGETRYECDFSINLPEQKIEYGVAC
jgi:hypothetical protein